MSTYPPLSVPHECLNIYLVFYCVFSEIQTDAGPSFPAAPPCHGGHQQPCDSHGSHDGDDVTASSGSTTTTPPSSSAASCSAHHFPTAMPRSTSAAHGKSPQPPPAGSPSPAPPPAPGLASCTTPVYSFTGTMLYIYCFAQ